MPLCNVCFALLASCAACQLVIQSTSQPLSLSIKAAHLLAWGMITCKFDVASCRRTGQPNFYTTRYLDSRMFALGVMADYAVTHLWIWDPYLGQ